MGKLKKVGIGFGIVILSFFVLAAIGGSVPDTEIESTGIDKFKAKSYEEMNSSELSLIAIDWDYRDLMRNFDNYENQIIFVDGTVTNIQRSMNSVNLCMDMGTFSCDDLMFLRVNENKWLEDDELSGFVEVIELRETGNSNMFTGGEWVGSGEYVPRVNEIRLICDNC